MSTQEGQSRRMRSRRAFVLGSAAVLSLTALAGLVMAFRPGWFVGTEPRVRLQDFIPTSAPKQPDLPRVADYLQAIEPLLAEAEAADRAALPAARREFQGFMAAARGKVPEFSEAMVGLGTCVKMTGNMVQGLREADAQRFNTALVQELFNKHIFTQDAFKAATQQYCESVTNALAANRDRLLACVTTTLASDDQMSRFPAIRHDELARCVQDSISADTARLCVLSLKGEILALASQILISAVTRLATAVGSVTAGATAAAGGAAAGRTALVTAGLAGGPVGCAAVLLLSVGVEIAVTAHMKKEITQVVTTMLNDLERQLLVGDENHPGLNRTLAQHVEAYHVARRRELRLLVEGHCRALRDGRIRSRSSECQVAGNAAPGKG